MNIQRKELWVTSFGLFSLFFGAGNLLLPPLLGYNAGEDWLWVTIGFMITAVVIPIFGILAHARLQGTLFDFGLRFRRQEQQQPHTKSPFILPLVQVRY